MSIQSEINRITTGVASAYAAAEVRGAAMPSSETVDNLADTVLGIPTGGLTFTNVAVIESSFIADTTYSEYPYRAAISLAGVTAGMMPDVVFSVEDAESGNFSPTSASYDGGVYIYAVEPASITIPTIHVGDQRQPFLEAVYPVGAIYISAVTTDPRILFGFGTWERIQDRFLLAAGSTYAAGATGGEATHTLTVDEMPSHSHVVSNYASMVGWSGSSPSRSYLNNTNDGYVGSNDPVSKSTGGGAAHNNMPPYLAVCVWQRVA